MYTSEMSKPVQIQMKDVNTTTLLYGYALTKPLLKTLAILANSTGNVDQVCVETEHPPPI